MPGLPEISSGAMSSPAVSSVQSSPNKNTKESSPMEANLIKAESSSYTPSEYDMRNYYERLLPFKSVFEWLNHSPIPQTDFTMREFAFEFKSGAYQRYNSFVSAKEFKDTVVRVTPTRFEIGAVYSINPSKRKTVSKNMMKPIEKEFVVDIDLTDYDDIRTCCSKTGICHKCWKFINVAIEIVDTALRDDFGFEHMIWVFSGRRGAHCWVSDQRARSMNDTLRKAVIDYLDVLNLKGGHKNRNLTFRRPLHPHIERSTGILLKSFKEVILEEQDPWRDDKRAIEDLAKKISDAATRDSLAKLWTEKPGRSSLEKWKDIDTQAKKGFAVRDWKTDIVILSMYPRLDIEVSKLMGHLLKSPFCIHPKTGNVCVPFDPRVKEFWPDESPNLRSLQSEIEEWDTNHPGKSVKHEWEKTSLNEYIKMFNNFKKKLNEEELQSRKRNRGQLVDQDDKSQLEF
ncbi:hypothetical protein LJB42_000960 [Komagataella kurtzmanii]|nr:hypothetical protein LJB42_000960 [Komagataella kurtzmanii]